MTARTPAEVQRWQVILEFECGRQRQHIQLPVDAEDCRAFQDLHAKDCLDCKIKEVPDGKR